MGADEIGKAGEGAKAENCAGKGFELDLNSENSRKLVKESKRPEETGKDRKRPVERDRKGPGSHRRPRLPAALRRGDTEWN